MDQQDAFSYTYSAPEKQEVLNIRRKYLPQQESKLEELKRLDGIVQSAGVVASLVAGVSGCLLFGLGLCLAMEVIGHMVWLGILLGLAGSAGMLSAFPVYRRYFDKAKARYAPRILELSEKLMKE